MYNIIKRYYINSNKISTRNVRYGNVLLMSTIRSASRKNIVYASEGFYFSENIIFWTIDTSYFLCLAKFRRHVTSLFTRLSILSVRCIFTFYPKKLKHGKSTLMQRFKTLPSCHWHNKVICSEILLYTRSRYWYFDNYAESWFMAYP